MNKVGFITLVLFLLLISNVFALSMTTSGTTTIITGTVYKFKILPGNEVPFAHVNIFCRDASAELTANYKGDFAVGFDKNECMPGDTIEVQAYSPDYSLFGELITSCTKGARCKDIVCNVTNASPVLTDYKHEIPEFSPLAAGLALLGSCLGFIILRRKK
ncbi:MAG: hypothetical protein QW404_00420 [Candidatus Nanoarchaeia archaeon]